MVDGSSAVWFGAPNFEVLEVADDGVDLIISIESTVMVTGCASCGTRARAKDRRWVRLRDAPSADRAVRVERRKRVWSSPEPDCAVKTWTERSPVAAARRVLALRAGEWATDRIAAIEGTSFFGAELDRQSSALSRTCQPIAFARASAHAMPSRGCVRGLPSGQ